MKSQIRLLGIDDPPFAFTDEYGTISGVVMHGGRKIGESVAIAGDSMIVKSVSKYLGDPMKYSDLKQAKGIIAKIKDTEERSDSPPNIETVQKIVNETMEKKEVCQNSSENYNGRIVCSEKEIIQLSNLCYDCQFIGHEK